MDTMMRVNSEDIWALEHSKDKLVPVLQIIQYKNGVLDTTLHPLSVRYTHGLSQKTRQFCLCPCRQRSPSLHMQL